MQTRDDSAQARQGVLQWTTRPRRESHITSCSSEISTPGREMGASPDGHAKVGEHLARCWSTGLHMLPHQIEQSKQSLLTIVNSGRPDMQCAQQPGTFGWRWLEVEKQSNCICNYVQSWNAQSKTNCVLKQSLGQTAARQRVTPSSITAREAVAMQEIGAEIEDFGIRPKYSPVSCLACESIDEHFRRPVLAIPYRKPEHLDDDRCHSFSLSLTIIRIFGTPNLVEKTSGRPPYLPVIKRSKNALLLMHRWRRGHARPFQSHVDIVDIHSLRHTQTPNNRSRMAWTKSKFARKQSLSHHGEDITLVPLDVIAQS